MIVDRPRLPIRQMLTVGLLPSPLKAAYYRLRGCKIGKGVRMGIGTVILADEAEIGDGTTIAMGATITCAKLKIGKRTKIQSLVQINAQEVSIGNDVTISEVALIRSLIPSSQSMIILHDRVHIFPFTVIDPSRKVEMGEESCLGHGSSIYTHSSYKSKLDGYPVEFGPVTIGKRVWLSSNVFVSQSVSIGDDAVIGTGTVVSRDIPSGVLVASAAARIVKSKELFAEDFSEPEKLAILGDIIDEFCGYLSDFAGYQWYRLGAGLEGSWELVSRDSRDHSRIMLMRGCSTCTNEGLSVILHEIPEDRQQQCDGQRRYWFSVGSHQCSEQLDSLGEELREYFKRYGIYFARA